MSANGWRSLSLMVKGDFPRRNSPFITPLAQHKTSVRDGIRPFPSPSELAYEDYTEFVGCQVGQWNAVTENKLYVRP